MIRPRLRMLLSSLILAIFVGAAGCSTLPTAPTAPSSSDVATTSTSATPSEVLGLESLLGASTATTTTRQIGILGGIVSAGNFTVVIPAGALLRTATVTVSQPDPARPVVSLGIAPSSANKFLLPVLLVANAKSMDRTLLSVAYLSYYNPSTGRWERVSGSQVDLLGLTVSAPLWHFSVYRVESGGKAGW
jgi:hypothetical protein